MPPQAGSSVPRPGGALEANERPSRHVKQSNLPPFPQPIGRQSHPACHLLARQLNAVPPLGDLPLEGHHHALACMKPVLQDGAVRDAYNRAGVLMDEGESGWLTTGAAP